MGINRRDGKGITWGGVKGAGHYEGDGGNIEGSRLKVAWPEAKAWEAGDVTFNTRERRPESRTGKKTSQGTQLSEGAGVSKKPGQRREGSVRKTPEKVINR